MTVLALGLLLTGCTGDPTEDAAPTSAAPSPGPLALSSDDPDGGALPTTAVFELGVSEDGTPAVVYDDQQAGDDLSTTRIGLGTDPAQDPVTPTDVESGSDIGSPVVDGDGGLTALALLNGDEAFGVHVLRVGADGAQTATRVPDAGIRTLSYATAEAVSDDGRTAVVATTDPGTDDPAELDQLEVVTVDLATATVTGRVVADLGTDVALDPLDVGIGPDGAVSVLVGADPGAGDTTGAALARFAPGLAYSGVVVLDAAAEFQTALLDLTGDGTAVVTLQPGSVSGLSTRVLTVAPGGTDVVAVADLDQVSVRALVAGPDGWVHLVAVDYADDGFPAVLPLDLTTGEPADPVDLCIDGPGQPLGLARSGSGSTLLAWATCARGDIRVVALTGS